MIRPSHKSFPLFIASALVLAAVSVARADVKTACASDVKSYCPDIKPKDGRLRDCMAENRAKLSNECKIAVGERTLDKDAKRAAKKAGTSGMAPKDKKDDDDD